MVRPNFEHLKSKTFQTRALSSLVLLPVVVIAIWLGGGVFNVVLTLLALALCAEISLAIWNAENVFRHRAIKAFHIVLGIVLAVVFCASLYTLRTTEGAGTHGELLFILAVLIWSVDTFAYIGGNLFGGPKFAPRISPNKTWSGTVVGLGFGTAIASALFITVLGWESASAFMVSLACAALAIMGDLMVSLVKRYYGIKDTSNLIPGHGGLWDRVDSFLIVMPLMALWLALSAGALT